jgi:hypothetical protein
MFIEEEGYQRVEKFLEKLLGTQGYYIDPKIKEIPYQRSCLSQKLLAALDNYQKDKNFSALGIPRPTTVSITHSMRL